MTTRALGQDVRIFAHLMFECVSIDVENKCNFVKRCARTVLEVSSGQYSLAEIRYFIKKRNENDKNAFFD